MLAGSPANNCSLPEASANPYRLPLDFSNHAPIAGKDQSYVIAAILENLEPHDRQIYPLYGLVEMNYNEIADAISQTLGIPVRYW